MPEPNALSRQFDAAAELYDEVRPRYPAEIIEHIINFAALPTYGRILEVGCGTGQMTLPFAQQGYAVLALDQGEQLAALAARHCQPYPQVRVVPCAFEAWQEAVGDFDLFLSAQAFHWIARSQGSAFWQATAPIYDTYNPQTSSGNMPLEAKVEIYRQALRTSREFVGLHEVRHAWARRYTGEAYMKLLQTFSDHRALPEPNKSRFFAAIGQVIAQMGGEVTRDYETLALLARKG
jgi:SAM-dependent methyltransferase